MKTFLYRGLLLAISASALCSQTPVFLSQPVSQVVPMGVTVSFSAVLVSATSVSYRWRKDGTDLRDGTEPGSSLRVAGSQSSVLVLSGAQGVPLEGAGIYSVIATNNLGSVTSALAGLFVGDAVTLPANSPNDASTTAGAGAAFNVTPGGTPPFTYQWSKDGVPIAGAVGPTIDWNNVHGDAAGLYSVVVRNPRGSVASRAARLTVTPALAPPVIVAQPASPAAFVGGTVTMVVAAVSPAGFPPMYQWFKDGVEISPATNATAASATLQLNNLTFAQSGVYAARVTNSLGSVASVPVAMNVTTTAMPSWRFINVSTRTMVGAGENILIQGFVVSGSASKQVLVRAVGPTLNVFGVTGVLANPVLAIFQGATKLAENDDWNGTAALTTAFGAVAAFSLPANSRDAALVVTLAPGTYTAQVTGVAGTTGVALVEVYELP